MPAHASACQPTPEERAAREVLAHLQARYRISTGDILSKGMVARLRVGDVMVWFRCGEISYSTGELDGRGRPKLATFPLNQTAVAARHIATRYRELRGLAGLRIG